MSYSTDPVLDASRYYDALDAREALMDELMQDNAARFVVDAKNGNHSAFLDVAVNYKDFDQRLVGLLMARYGKDAELTKLVNDMAAHWAWLNTEEV